MQAKRKIVSANFSQCNLSSTNLKGFRADTFIAHKSRKFARRHVYHAQSLKACVQTALLRTNLENLRGDTRYRTQILKVCVQRRLSRTNLENLRADNFIVHKSQKFACRKLYRAQISKICA